LGSHHRPGQENIQALDNEDPEGATVSGIPNKEGVLQGQEEVATTGGTILTRWYFKRGPPSCEPDSVMLEMARERVDATASGAQESFLLLAALVTQLSSDPIAAEVGAFLGSQHGKMVSAYAALRAARGAARDAASAAYGQHSFDDPSFSTAAPSSGTAASSSSTASQSAAIFC